MLRCSRPPFAKGVHSAGCLTFDATVTYPFHPLVGQSVLVVGAIEHGGARHLIIRKPSDGSRFLPEWMTSPTAGATAIVSCPRLSVNRLVELRTLLDRLMASSSGNNVPGGQSNETIAATPNGSVQDTTVERTVAASANGGAAAAEETSDGGRVSRESGTRRDGRSGERR